MQSLKLVVFCVPGLFSNVLLFHWDHCRNFQNFGKFNKLNIGGKNKFFQSFVTRRQEKILKNSCTPPHMKE
jgi:hypothetical protein